MTYYQPYDPIICKSRPAVFLWYEYAGHRFARIRFSDTNGPSRTVNVMDIKPLAQACVDALTANGFEIVEVVSG